MAIYRPESRLGHLPSPESELRSRAVLVTGATSPIGREIAIAFAREGAGVHVHHSGTTDDSYARAGEVGRTLLSLGSEGTSLAADFTSEESIARALAFLRRGNGSLDYVILNAAAGFKFGSQDALKVNFTGQRDFLLGAVPYLRSGARVIFNQSLAGFLGRLNLTGLSKEVERIVGFYNPVASAKRQMQDWLLGEFQRERPEIGVVVVVLPFVCGTGVYQFLEARREKILTRYGTDLLAAIEEQTVGLGNSPTPDQVAQLFVTAAAISLPQGNTGVLFYGPDKMGDWEGTLDGQGFFAGKIPRFGA